MISKENNAPKYLNPNLSPEERSKDLIPRMTLAEKVSQLMADAPAVDRLGVPAYNWWNEALHGVARAGTATVFPQAIGIAATWNEDLVYRMANAISDEARAKHHHALRSGERGWYQGLTMWSPNINIFRDPRWGRGQETYGEDPYLTARIGIQFVKGLQGDDPKYLKTAACAKHFAAHSGPEADRHHFDAQVSERDLKMTYLPAFEVLVREAEVAGVMGAYNRLNGQACCADPNLLIDLLRDEWGFQGYVVSDCGAIRDIYMHHELVDSPRGAAAMALRAGCDLNCGNTYQHLMEAVGKGLLSEYDIDIALTNLFNIRFRLGMFDPDEDVGYAQTPIEVIDSPANQALSLEVARQSLVLLKNEDELLPLRKDISSIAVIGPNSDDPLVLRGNYYGTPSNTVTILEGIREVVSPNTIVTYARGCEILESGTEGFEEALRTAGGADVAILVMGLSQQVEGEEGQQEGLSDGRLSQGDREDIVLPGDQEALLKAVIKTGTPVVLVLLNGSALAINWAAEHVPSILEAWYPGQAGGRAVAEALFGDFNPGGRLPMTFYRSIDQLPPFDDYNMAGRTYRYFEGDALYPFGYGLSYTRFEYQDLSLSHDRMSGPETLYVSCIVRNVGVVRGDEVVQVYIRDEEASTPVPRHSLAAFKRIHLAPGAEQRLTFEIHPKQFAMVSDEGRWVVEPGRFAVFIGGGQPGTNGVLSTHVEMIGERFFLK